MDSENGNGVFYIDLSIGSPASIVVSNKLHGEGNAHIGFSDGTYFTYDSLVN